MSARHWRPTCSRYERQEPRYPGWVIVLLIVGGGALGWGLIFWAAWAL